MSIELRRIVQPGLIGAVAAWHVSLVGLVEAVSARRLIGESVTLGYVLLLGVTLIAGYVAARRAKGGWLGVGSAALTGLIVGVAVSLLALLVSEINLRSVLNAASPTLVQALTFGKGPGLLGVTSVVVANTIVGIVGGGLTVLPASGRRVVATATVVTLLTALLRDVVGMVVPAPLASKLFVPGGLSMGGAGLVLVVSAAAVTAREALAHRHVGRRPVTQQMRWSRLRGMTIWAVGLLMLATFPMWGKLFLSNVADFVGLYIIMALGLNLVVGFAGLLDLGYVAFFAIGAYTMARLTSPELASTPMDFWVALPFAVLVTVAFGVLLGLPVLRMRGDYLAIATLGFGEIVRLLVLSDWLKPHIGGAQGVTRIARPELGTITFDRPQHFYYLILVGGALAWFLAVRLKESRLGRAWMAIREDEDVAQAMGINRVTAKLLAFALGAALGGLSGAIFASLVGSVVPASFSLLVSINVLAIIIVGGMGSLPGVVVGALALVALPELLREFQEYRLLVYGAVLVAMMIYRPAGLWPEATRVRELEEVEPTRPPAAVGAPVAEGAGQE